MANSNSLSRADAAAQPHNPVIDPADWQADDLQARQDWLFELTAAHVEEICSAVNELGERNIDIMSVDRQTFALPTLGPALQAQRQKIAFGTGMVHIRGLPVHRLGKTGSAMAFWGISQHLGDGVWSQNKRGHVLGHVTDLGQTKNNPTQRGPYSRESIPFHVDCADIVGLLCLQPPVRGGESRIASSVRVHNEILLRRPDLLPVLYAPYYRDRRDEIPPGMQPWYSLAVFHFRDGHFSASIEPTYMKSPQRFDAVPEMTAEQAEALALVESIADEIAFDLDFQHGDMQFLNNHVVFHSRRAYQDADAADQKRHLLRIWLKLLDGRPLPRAFYERHAPDGRVDRPGGILGPDTTLNAPLHRT